MRRLARSPDGSVRRSALLVLVLLLAPSVVAHHETPNTAGDGLPKTPDPVRDAENALANLSTTPTLDHARDQLLAIERAAFETAREEARARNVSAEVLPSGLAPVFRDAFDAGHRVGGLGDWRVLAGAWRVDGAVGLDGSAAYTMTNATHGRYASGESLLVSPAIDLSAYPAQAGAVPYAANHVSRQVLLLFRQAYTLMNLVDGGQVYLFLRDPEAPGARRILLEPMAGFGAYADGVSALGGRGFTGHRDWHQVGFDLTPFSGRTLWLGFRLVASPKADATPPPDWPSQFEGAAPYGWRLDDLEVVTPAWGLNLKVVDVTGPSFRLDEKDPLVRIPPGENATVRAEILHAAASAREAVARLTVDGLGKPTVATARAFLRPGEVWRPAVTFLAPDTPGARVTVTAEAWYPGLDGGPAPGDPTPDNADSRTFLVSRVQRADVRVTPSSSMVDDGGTVHATVRVTNTGNSDLRAILDVREHLPSGVGTPAGSGGTAELGALDVDLAPGAARSFVLAARPVARGEHAIVARLVDAGVLVANATARYYVHASPPPAFFDPGDAARPWRWTAERATAVPVLDDWMWVSRHSGAAVPNTLIARATPDATAEGDGVRFKDLKLTARYFPLEMVSMVVEISRPNPVGFGASTDAARSVVWRHEVDVAGSPEIKEQRLAWQDLAVYVDPLETEGYLDTWSARGLEVAVRAAHGATAGNATGLFLDDLRLSGVPVGGDPADRLDIVRITGNETYIRGAPPTDVGPVFPSACAWERETFLEILVKQHCWRRVSAADARAALSAPDWSRLAGPVPARLGRSDAIAVMDTTASNDPSRLLSQPIRLEAATSPVLTFDHAYAFTSAPLDTPGLVNSFRIGKVGFVEVQWLLPDGTWSPFHRLEPVGGYPHPLEKNDAGQTRTKGAVTSWTPYFGFYHPGACDMDVFAGCDGGGYYKNVDASGQLRWREYPPTPKRETSTFFLDPSRLGGKNLSDAVIRIAFHASSSQGAGGSSKSVWTIDNVRLNPVRAFASDGSLEGLALAIPYDWRTLGVGPGTRAPINATVRNVGLYPEDFAVALNVSRLNGNGTERTFPVGRLLPNETRSILLEWDVPDLDETIAYEIRARVFVAGTGASDENFFNDERSIGSAGELVARRRVDAAVEARVFPSEGREDLARHLPITLVNRGNVPLDDLIVRRTLERAVQGGSIVVSDRTWIVRGALDPDPAGVPLRRLATDPPLTAADEYLTPGASGLYRLRVEVTLAPGLRDERPDDNEQTAKLVARAALAFEDFDRGFAWRTPAPDVWDRGEGFRSASGLEASNRSSGLLRPMTDAWVETPMLPLSRAQDAVVNLFTRHDLERGYDGGLLEISTDGSTWFPVPPTSADDSSVGYASHLVGSNPLAAGIDPSDEARALTGSSFDDPRNLDGWIPLSFDLANVPGLSENVEFLRVAPPAGPPGPIERIGRGAYAWPALTTSPSDPSARWELHNLTEDLRAVEGTFWWSGFATTGSVESVRSLERNFNVSTAGPDEVVTLSWRDARSGTQGSDWRGIGGSYEFALLQRDAQGILRPLSTHADLEAADIGNGWSLVSIPVEAVDKNRDFTARWTFRSKSVSVANLGWAIENVTLAASRVENGRWVVSSVFSPADEEVSGWTANGWTRVEAIPSRPAPWALVAGAGPEGMPQSIWRFNFAPNADARLVSPAIDLAGVGGTSATLELVHRRSMHVKDDTSTAITSGTDWRFDRHYQAGVVEVSAFNTTSGRWDPYRQVFGKPAGPSQEPRSRAVDAGNGAPYSHPISDAGDPFPRFTREFLQKFKVAGLSTTYNRLLSVPTSYAFSGQTAGSGFERSVFDLSAFMGKQVRIAFHAWSTPTTASGSWSIARAEIAGRVLSAPDATLRFRLGTDASVLPGSWSIDQFEVSARLYGRSVGVHLDPIRVPVSSEPFVVSGHLRNYGAEARPFLGVGLADRTAKPIALATVREGGVVAAPGYLAAAGPFHLAPAGEPGSEARFGFLVKPAAGANFHTIGFELLEAGFAQGSAAYAAADDEVPGRAKRAVHLPIVESRAAAIEDLAFAPSVLAAPGEVRASGRAHNVGTRTLDLVLAATWRDPDGHAIASVQIPVGEIPPGDRRTFEIPRVNLTRSGNHTLRLQPLEGQTPLGAPLDRVYRVATSDVALVTSFESSLEPWSGSGFRRVDDDRAGGAWSVLFGATNEEHARGQAATGSGTLASPRLDLRHALPDTTLTFWHKPAFGPAGSLLLRCDATAIPWPAGARAAGRAPAWEFVEVPLPPSCLGRNTTLVFAIANADGQGWRLDDVGVTMGRPSIARAPASFEVGDSAVKQFPVRVANPGSVPKAIRVGIEPRLSTLLPDQRAWFSAEPDVLLLGPGESGRVNVRVETPAARGLFSQSLVATVQAVDALAPGTGRSIVLPLRFEPAARPDLSVAVAIDGRPVGPARFEVEEAVPHEVSLVVINQGAVPSRATRVELSIVDERTGAPVWSHEDEVPALAPFGGSEEAALVAGSWRPEYGARGNHSLRIAVDPDRLHADYDRANDNLAHRLAVTRLVRPDLVADPTGLLAAKPDGTPVAEAVPGELVRILGSVTNAGIAPARDVVVRMLNGASVLKEERFDALAPGETRFVHVTQFAPAASTTYRLQASTADVELFSSNNEATLALPIFPPEIAIARLASPKVVEPGVEATIVVPLSNVGAHPWTLDLSVSGGRGSVEPDRVALAPGESREVVVRLAVPPHAAGPRPAVLRAEGAGGLVFERTLPITIREVTRVDVVPMYARGPPATVRVDVVVVNPGNTRTSPLLEVLDADGARLAARALEPLDPGATRTETVVVGLPRATPAGHVPAIVRASAGTAESRSETLLDVQAWGAVEFRAPSVSGNGERGFFAWEIVYDGNVASVRRPALFGAPEGVRATFDRNEIRLDPGATLLLNASLEVDEGAAPGLHELRVALIDPGRPSSLAELKAESATIPLDLRRARLALEATLPRAADAGRDVEIPVRVTNMGDRASSVVAVDLYVDGVLQATIALDPIAPGRAKDAILRWTPRDGARNLAVVLDPRGPHALDAPAVAATVLVQATIEGNLENARRSVPGPEALFAAVAALVAFRGRRSPRGR
ncbi:MAG TPA: CARDB domain-containing protein [Candidatus Thermoplasmatota archaeon]|nr:CARDB domain-containing protein [Candidatus Thermoplasmatota archaeon]